MQNIVANNSHTTEQICGRWRSVFTFNVAADVCTAREMTIIDPRKIVTLQSDVYLRWFKIVAVGSSCADEVLYLSTICIQKYNLPRCLSGLSSSSFKPYAA